MPRPMIKQPLTHENILARMKPGMVYQRHQLATSFHVSADEIRPVLDAMVAGGQLEHSVSKPKGFRRAGDAPAPVRDEVATSIAAPRAIDPMVGTISGYDAAIARRVALCMLARGAR